MKQRMKKLLNFIANEVFVESFKYLSGLYTFINNSKLDSDIRELVDEYKLKYFVEGWNILVGIMKLGFFIPLVIMLFLYGPNHFLVKRVSILLFMVLIITSVLKFLFDKFRLIRENAFLAIIFVQGMVWINGNLGKSKYAFYEFWFAYCYMSQFCSLMTWVNLKLKYLIKMY